MRKRTIMFLGLALTLDGVGISRLHAAEHPGSHRFGEWPAISAMIHNEYQKHLNLDVQGFLVEIWFSPLPLLPNKGSGPSVLISKKAADHLRGYTLAYENRHIGLTLCDGATELDKDLAFSADAGLADDQWCYFAAGYSGKDKTLTFYKDGATLKVFPKVELGDLSNSDTFNIGYFEDLGNSPAHCRIREARVWKLRNGLPDNLDSVVETHHRDPSQVSATLAAGANYSRWVFTPDHEDVADLGNNGNALCYVPFGYQERVKIKPLPSFPTGTTYFVDHRHPQATDEGGGTRDKPFRTIHRGLKAAYPGDVLHICAGVYREGIYPRAGENGNPVTIEGEDGTIIMGSEPLRGWESRADGIWAVTNWSGGYAAPADPSESDARSDAGNLIFVDEEPMDFVKTKFEMVPGTWTAEPLLGRGPKTILLSPLPGVDPIRSQVEITVPGLGGLTATKFNHIKGLRFLRCGGALRGRGNVLEHCTFEWVSFGLLGIYGQDHIVRSNRFLWGGNCAIAGSTARLLFENNLLSYNGWRNYASGWGGGAIKFIPANIDHLVRNNEFCYNDIATVWYDTGNQGNVIEGNICRDNSGHGGIFDEGDFGNLFKYNLCYNNYGQGICIAESSEDKLYRNIIFNNYRAGVFFRGGDSAVPHPPEHTDALRKKDWQKLDVRRYQGFITYEREKKLRDMGIDYFARYPVRAPGRKNEVRENVIFENCGWGGLEVNQLVKYASGVPVDPEFVNVFSGNIYWNTTNRLIFSNGSHCTLDLDFKTWQGRSGQDQDSRFMSPFENWDQMPEWFRQRFTFKRDEFRSIADVMDGYLANLRKSTSRTMLMSRLLRSRALAKAMFTDPMLFGVYFETEGKRCVSLWSKGVGMREFLVPDAQQVVYESKYLRRRTLDAQDGRVSVFVGEEPVTVIGIGQDIKEDRGVVLEVPMWTEPGKPVPAKLILENPDVSPRDYDLTVGVGEGWTVSDRHVVKTLPSGGKTAMDLTLMPPESARQGMFLVSVAGQINRKSLAVSRNFGIGSLLVLKWVKGGTLRMDGDLSDWGDLGIPNGIAEAREQVVFGADNLKGADDLSARVWLRWNEMTELYLALEVTDDKLVTAHRKDSPRKCDSIQVLVDVRAEWKHYMKECTPGTFNLTLVPGDGPHPATASYGQMRVGSIRGVASRKTDKGYIMEVNVHFHTGEVEDPGWVANRPLRIGVLVNDVDDPQDTDRKTTMGVWRTAADAAENCASLTTFVTEK